QIPDNAAEDSVSNLTLWNGSQETIREAKVHHSFFGSFSIRKGDWKLEMCNGSGGGTLPNWAPEAVDLPPIQLYRLSDDIGERENLWQEYPEKVEELKALLVQYIVSGRSTPGAPQENFPCENWPGLEWMNAE
ncbi:MAG: arylsulfatase, partial [Oscillospiraceae bacterium]|nr:arylsulfatase [Oscillospiraceae bacterium]